MFDLIAQDDAVRVRALARQQDLVAGRSRTLFWYLDTLEQPSPRGSGVSVEHWPFVALYLRWEALFPNEWDSRGTHLCSPWTVKEVVLGHLGRNGVPAEVGPDAADLLLDVVHRSYRCKDWRYALLVRHVADAGFRDRLTALTDADDPLVGRRARFLLDLADRPDQKVTRNTWRRWLEGRD